jgi:AcrR family transcriptional regulator
VSRQATSLTRAEIRNLEKIGPASMARPSKEQRAAAGGPAWEGRRSEIIRIAAELFDRQGYAQTSVDQIARAANLQKASLYHYCDSKADLLVQVHNDFMDLLFRKLRDIEVRGEAPEIQLRSVVLDIVSLMSTHRAYVRTLFEHYREAPEKDRRRIAMLRRKYEDTVMNIVEKGIADGSLRDIDPHYVTMTIFGAANWTYQWYGRSGGDVARVSDAICAVLFEGLRS